MTRFCTGKLTHAARQVAHSCGGLGSPQAPAKRTSNEFNVRFTSLLLSSTVSTTYAEPIHPRALYGAVPPDYGRLDEIGLRACMINGWS